MDPQKSGAHSSAPDGAGEGEIAAPSRSPPPPRRKRSLSLRRLRSPPSQGGRSYREGAAAAVAGREEVVPPLPLPASTSAYGRLEGIQAPHTPPRRSLAAPRPTAIPPNTTRTPSAQLPASVPPPPQLPPVWPEEIKYQRCYCEEGSYLLAAQLEEELEARRLRGGQAGDGQEWRWEVWVVIVSNRDKTVLLWHQKASKSPELNHAVLWDYHVFVMVSRQKILTKETVSVRQVTDAQYTSSPPRPSSNSLAAPLPPRRTRSLFGRSKDSAATEDQSPSQFSSPPASTPDWSAWVYDIDSCLCSEPGVPITPSTLRPVPFQTYVSKTFAYSPGVYPAEYLPMFRLARAGAFLDNFASDRSHMISPSGSSISGGGAADDALAPEYSAPVPPWPVIVGPRARRKGWTNNLMNNWVNMDDGRQRAVKEGGTEWQNQSEELKVQFGKVMLREEFFAGKWKMATWRRRTGGEGAEVDPRFASPKTAMKLGHELSMSVSPPIQARKGGRVSSPLFPAYMAASLQARAARPRESYLALGTTGGPGKQLWPDSDGRQQSEGGKL